MRRAFAFASIEQYLVTIVGFASVYVIARLLTPAEIGASAIGVGIATIAFTARAFVSSEFLIQRPTLDRADIATAFTLMGSASLALAALIYLASGWVAALYDQPGLAVFLQVMCAAALCDTITAPIQAILRREIAFSTLAGVNVAGATVAAGVTILCAVAGMGFMSIAWGHASGALVKAACAVAARPGALPLRLSLAGWRANVTFGSCKGAMDVVDRFYEAMPQLILGRVMPVSAVGYYNRANLLCGIPDRLMMAAVFSFTFPALAARIRAGGELKATYLRAQSYISVIFCPALALVALLADPLVAFALGPGWDPVIPLVRILSLAALFWFPIILTVPTLFALGANRSALEATLIGRGFGMIVLGSASFFGLTALAMSQFIAIPFYAFVSLSCVRAHVGFSWIELLRVTLRSFAVLAFALTPPAAFAALSGSGLAMSFWQAVACGGFAAMGWLTGVVIFRHPIVTELRVLSDYARGLVGRAA